MILKSFDAPPNPVRKSLGLGAAVEIRQSDRTVFTSGQVGMREDGSIVDGPAQQIQQALDNFIALIRAMDLTLDNVVKYTFYLTDVAHSEVLLSIFVPAI